MMAKRQIIPLFVPHLGCPNCCVFCNQRRITGQQRPITPQDVIDTIHTALPKLQSGKPAEVAFYGGSFTAIPLEEQCKLLEAVQPYLRAGTVTGIRLSTRPDCLDAACVSRLLHYGVETVELGVQSMCDEVLVASGRGHTAADTCRAVPLLQDAGLHVILQMMTGLPEDTPERSIATAKACCALRPDGVRIYPTVILRDTPLCDLWKAGIYREHTVEEAVALCAVLTEIFEKAEIPIIRMGLNPTEDLSGGDAVAGAYHPAFGELVYARRYLQRARGLLREKPMGKSIVIGVSRGCTSRMVGQHRTNLTALRDEFQLTAVRVKEMNLGTGEIVILPG